MLEWVSQHIAEAVVVIVLWMLVGAVVGRIKPLQVAAQRASRALTEMRWRTAWRGTAVCTAISVVAFAIGWSTSPQSWIWELSTLVFAGAAALPVALLCNAYGYSARLRREQAGEGGHERGAGE